MGSEMCIRDRSYLEVTPARGTSPASEPAGFFSTLSRRFLPSFLQMSRPGSAPLTQPAVASDEFVTAQTSLPPTASNSVRVAVPGMESHHGATPPLVPARAASPVRATTVPRGQLLFQDYPYSGPVSASPVITVQSQLPVMVSSQRQITNQQMSRLCIKRMSMVVLYLLNR